MRKIETKKLAVAVTALALCVGVLTGCGGASSAASSAVSSEAASAVSAAASEPAEAALPDGVYTAEFDTDSGMFHANEACDGGRVTVNGKVARASYDVKVGDVIALHFGERVLAVEVLDVSETAGKSEASLLYREVNAQ